jgi:hypothetical protein
MDPQRGADAPLLPVSAATAGRNHMDKRKALYKSFNIRWL